MNAFRQGLPHSSRARLTALCTLAALAACATSPPGPQTRQAYVAELMADYDIEGTISHEQAEALAEGRRAMDRVRGQMADAIARATPAQRDKLEAALDRFVSAARTMPDVNQASQVWAQAYINELTDEDLKKIVEFARTPAGKAQIAASNAAGAALRTYLSQQRAATVDRALKQYIDEVRSAMGVPVPPP